jgi:hypothetical protein
MSPRNACALRDISDIAAEAVPEGGQMSDRI